MKKFVSLAALSAILLFFTNCGDDPVSAGQNYLDENAKRDGVIVTDSGLQYEVLNEGTGDSPQSNSTVVVHYRGTLIDGTQFDSSYDRGEPATFRVDQVIAGWTEALQLMKVGSEYRLVIPPSLGYGNRGSGALIGPDEVLVFHVELLDIQ